MKARIKKEFENAGSMWWLSEKAGHIVDVEIKNGRLVEAGTESEMLFGEVDGLLPDEIESFLDWLQDYYGDSALFKFVEPGEVRVYVALGKVTPEPLKSVYVAEDGTAWLKPGPFCRLCGYHTFKQLFKINERLRLEPAGPMVCDNCGMEVSE